MKKVRKKKFAKASAPVTLHMGNGHWVKVMVRDGWLILTADSTLTVRPIDHQAVYVRPVGYEGVWVPAFAVGVNRA